LQNVANVLPDSFLPNELFEHPREVIIRVYDSQLDVEGTAINVTIYTKEKD
jgi:hypothetical protein